MNWMLSTEGIVLLFFIGLALCWFTPRWQLRRYSGSPRHLDKAAAEVEDSFRRTTAQVIGGFAVLLSVNLAFSQFQLSSKELEHKQIADMIGHLGHAQAAPRIAAIHNLKDLARRSGAYEPAVFATLQAFVRTQRGAEDSGKDLRGAAGRPSWDVLEAVRALSSETFKGSRTSREGSVAGVDLYGADLKYLPLEGVAWSGFVLSKADLRQANLRRADLSHAALISTDLRGADLRDAVLVAADLQGADLSGTNLERANLSQANIAGANFDGAALSGANLTETFGGAAGQFNRSCGVGARGVEPITLRECPGAEAGRPR